MEKLLIFMQHAHRCRSLRWAMQAIPLCARHHQPACSKQLLPHWQLCRTAPLQSHHSRVQHRALEASVDRHIPLPVRPTSHSSSILRPHQHQPQTQQEQQHHPQLQWHQPMLQHHQYHHPLQLQHQYQHQPMRLQGGQLCLLEPCSLAAMLLLQATRHGPPVLHQQSRSLSSSGILTSNSTLLCSLHVHPAGRHCKRRQHLLACLDQHGTAISGCSQRETLLRLRRQLQLHQLPVPPSHP